MVNQPARRKLLLTAGSMTALSVLPLGQALAAPLTIDQIKKSGELRIGVEAAYPPFTFRKEGQIIGYDIDLADIFCKTLGVKPTVIDTAWAGVIPSLYSGKFDIIMSAMSYTAERVKRVGFSLPYAEASQAMLVRIDDANTIKSPKDLNNKIVAVKLGSPGQVLQSKINDALKAAGGPGFKELKIFDDHPAAYISLAQSKADVVFNTVPTLAMVLKDAPGKYALVKGVGADNWAGIACRTEDTDIVKFLDAEIKRLRADGTLEQLQVKWFGFKMNLSDTIPSFG
jgi:polar amino acid transport system substrate-binding protein